MKNISILSSPFDTVVLSIRNGSKPDIGKIVEACIFYSKCIVCLPYSEMYKGFEKNELISALLSDGSIEVRQDYVRGGELIDKHFISDPSFERFKFAILPTECDIDPAERRSAEATDEDDGGIAHLGWLGPEFIFACNDERSKKALNDRHKLVEFTNSRISHRSSVSQLFGGYIIDLAKKWLDESHCLEANWVPDFQAIIREGFLWVGIDRDSSKCLSEIARSITKSRERQISSLRARKAELLSKGNEAAANFFQFDIYKNRKAGSVRAGHLVKGFCAEMLDECQLQLDFSEPSSDIVVVGNWQPWAAQIWSSLTEQNRYEEVDAFQEVVIPAFPSIAECFREGYLSQDEALKLIKSGAEFRDWAKKTPPDSTLLKEYVSDLSRVSKLDMLPAKLVRWSIFTGIGAGLDAALASPGIGTASGLAVSAFDAFFLDKIVSGWRPRYFVQELCQTYRKKQF